METTLIFSEIVFNLTISLAVMVVGVLLAVMAYQLIIVARNLKELSGNLNDASVEAGEKISKALERLSELPILSYFFRKRPPEQPTKGRVKISNNKKQ